MRVRIGPPLTFPKVEHASPQLAAAVTDRIWPNVMLQWEWLGGLPPLRRAAVLGSGARATELAALLGRAGLEVERDARELSRHDLVCFAGAPDALPAALAEHGPRIPRRAGVLVLSAGVAPTLGAAAVAERTDSWAVGMLGRSGDELVLAAADPAFRRQVGDALRAAGARVVEGDVTPEPWIAPRAEAGRRETVEAA